MPRNLRRELLEETVGCLFQRLWLNFFVKIIFRRQGKGESCLKETVKNITICLDSNALLLYMICCSFPGFGCLFVCFRLTGLMHIRDYVKRKFKWFIISVATWHLASGIWHLCGTWLLLSWGIISPQAGAQSSQVCSRYTVKKSWCPTTTYSAIAI